RDPVEPRPLLADRRVQAVPREDAQSVVEAAQPVERLDHRPGVAARQVDAPEGAGEERVAAVQPALVALEEADGALRVAGGVQHLEADRPEADLAALLELDGGHARRDLER